MLLQHADEHGLSIDESDQLDQSNPNLSVSVAQTVSDIPPSDPMRLEPVFIKPSSFNETSTAHFYGMQRTLDDLDERIFDTSTRSSGTAVVLLWCHPGGGKSYVAQQYIYKNLDKFPGGVYWIPAKSKEEIIAGLWAVAEEAAMKDLKDPRTIEKESELARFVDAMKEWFEKKQEWLLVFDGVTITENEADQITHFSRYMPSSKNSAIILTSMDRFLEVEQLLFYPMAIRVEPLSEAEAIEMFFSEIKIKASTATEREREKAKKIVLHYNCIPLAILAVSQRIKLTGEPFLSFQVKEHPSDDAIVSAFKETLDSLEDYNHKPARNLMRILCYYGQYIPYEMVCLAITDLSRWDVDVTESSIGNSPSIDHTIIVLRKYALLDRNANLPNSNSREKRLSSVDMLSILGVVQGVFMVSVEKINETHFWLGLAVRTFCKSYEAAHSRITTRSKQGLVSDYRCYEVHGRKLLDHIKRYESRSKDKDKSLEYRRADLRRKLQHISKQIKARTPGSSQESISEFISVFDRQSSGSSIGPETPDRALSVDSTVSILDPDLPHHASPSTIHSASTQGNVHDNRHRRHTEDLYGTEPGDNPPTLLVRKETTKSESHLQMMIQSAHAPLSGSIPDDDLSDAPRDENVAKHRTVVANEQRQTNKKHMMKFFRSKTISAAPVTAVNPVQANAEPTARSPSLGPVTGRSGAEAALTSASRRASSQRLPPLILNVPDSPVSESAISPTFAESPTENLPIKSSRSSTSLHGPSPLSNLLAGLKFGKRSRASSTASERPRPASSPRPFTAQLNRTSSPDLFALDQQEQKQKNTSQPTHEQLLRMGPNNAPPQTIAVTKQTMSNRRPHSPSPLRQAKPAPKVIPQGYVSDMSMSRDPSGASAWTVAGSEPARYPTEASLDFGTPPPLSVGSRFPTSSIDAAQKFSSTGAWADDVSTVSNFGGQTMSRASSGPPGILSENGIIPIVSSPPLRTSPPAMNNTEFALQVPKDPPLLNSSRAAQLQNEFSQGKYRLQLPQTAYQTGAPLVAVSGGNVPRSSHADSAELARRFRNGEFRYGVPPPYPGHDRMPPAPVQWEGERGRGRRRRSVEALGDGRSGPEGGLSLFWERDA
ncbi:MAG: hypothetical protein M1814_006067 [Vezdaea aestivalis]|nr:MAG: hypothetical protein M1814_006067 [Vezdaea aestivalis]